MKKRVLQRVLAVVAVLAAVLAVLPPASASARSDRHTGGVTGIPAAPARPTHRHATATAGPDVHTFAAGQDICYVGFVEGKGWQSWVCNGDIAGTHSPRGQDPRTLESLAFIQWGAGTVCAQVFITNFGWQNERCGTDGQVFQVGTVNLNMDIHGMVMSVTAGTLCFRMAIIISTWADELCTTNGGIGGQTSPFQIDAFLAYFR
jgi:hypothetical protein